MKYRNLFLFLFLVIGLSVTYWFEERGSNIKRVEEKSQYQILNVKEFGELKGFKGIKLNFKKVGDTFISHDNIEFSTKKTNEFFTILSGLKAKSIIPNEDVVKVGRQFYIPDDSMKMSFEFEKGELEFILGKKLEYDQAFYMDIVKKGTHQIFIVNDESPDPNVYKNDSEYKKSDAKYKRLEMMFLLTNIFFYETKVFVHQNYDEKKINFKKIDISTFKNKKFQVDFEKTITVPEVPKSLKYDEDNWLAFHKTLINLDAKTIYYPIISINLDELLSRFEVTEREGKTYTVDIYKKYGSLSGYFLKTSLSDKLYELKNEDAQYFFVGVQDFWKKIIIPNSKEYDLKMVFRSDKSREETVKVSDKEIFNVTSPNKTLRILEVKKLIDFLKIPSDHVADVNKIVEKNKKNVVMDLYFENRHLGVILDENVVVLLDFNNNLKLLHYIGKTIPFSYRVQDYFEK